MQDTGSGNKKNSNPNPGSGTDPGQNIPDRQHWSKYMVLPILHHKPSHARHLGCSGMFAMLALRIPLIINTWKEFKTWSEEKNEKVSLIFVEII
jgi:hypothetical protein